MNTNPHDLACPLIDTTGNRGPYLNLGLTKREYFAAMAMQGLLACPARTDAPDDFVAQWAVNAADALIAALNKEPQS